MALLYPTQGDQFQDKWIYAYGSLMWQPEFPFQAQSIARLHGWRRSLCILSVHYRGTPEHPGLVLGLDRGGSCTGMAFQIAAHQWNDVWQQIYDREMISHVYVARQLPLHLKDGRHITAYGFVADRQGPQYWRGSPQEASRLLTQGAGSRGRSRDYLASTLQEMSRLGIRDQALTRILELSIQDDSLRHL